MDAWNRPSVVALYAAETELFPPEKSVLEAVRDRLAGSKMLDLGVGGGRTTVHFAPRVREYWGVDYSESMIAACRARFAGRPERMFFALGDAADLSGFPDGAFDFILFSFNGLDSLSPEDRPRALGEIRRLARPGGLVCLSTHNIWNLRRHFSLWHRLRRPWMFPRSGIEWFRLRWRVNPRERIRRTVARGHAFVNDGAHDFGFRTYYVDPVRQAEELEAWMKGLRVFALTDGRELQAKDSWRDPKEAWLTYLGEVVK